MFDARTRRPQFVRAPRLIPVSASPCLRVPGSGILAAPKNLIGVTMGVPVIIGPGLLVSGMSGRRPSLLSRLVLVALLLCVAPAFPQAEVAVPAPLTWHVRSPYTSLPRTRLLLDTIGMEILSGYTPGVWPESRTLPGQSGVRASRYFTKNVEGVGQRTVELVATAHPSGGYEVYVRGVQIRDGVESPNPELADIQSAVSRVVETLGAVKTEDPALDRRQLAYETYQLSYVEPDRALATLKALDYTIVEFEEGQGETIYDRIFRPTPTEQPRLPIVIKMIAASKTSLQESTADSGAYSGSREGLPDLGGIFLHRTTAAEPQNRILIAYDPYDLESLERLVNLLRNIVDVPARQIVMEALVIEIQGDVTRDLGISWGITGTSTSGDHQDTYDFQVAEEPRLVSTPLTFMFTRIADSFTFKAKLHALLETSRAKVLSNPSVLVLDGRQAKIQIGNRIPVVETTVTSSSATESVLYFPVGIVLNLRPRVSDDGSEISMQVETIVSSARQTLASAGSSTRAPEVESRQVQTFVRVQNDTPFIIGGLTTNDEIRSRRGIPILSTLPGIGPLFSRSINETVKKEIIIVVTPHLVPEDPKKFSFVIPQSSPIFDAFGRQLLYNAYRIRQQDVFDLEFLFESNAYQNLVGCARRYVERAEDRRSVDPEILGLLEGSIPGEEILIRRMLWEIVRKTDYLRFIDTDRIIFFEKVPKGDGENHFELAFLSKKLAQLDTQRNALTLTFDSKAEGTPDHPFGQPAGTLAMEPMSPEAFAARLAAGNARSSTGEPRTWSMVLTNAHSGTTPPFDALRGVLVMKSIFTLNPNLPLNIRGFQAGRQIVFPTETELQESWHLIDPQAAKLFYEVTSYYPAFEEEFKHRARRLANIMGCQWLGTTSPTP